ncbi:MAG: hypothetical protein Fur0032_01960 [Terrimicrobiaceae bacterium]
MSNVESVGEESLITERYQIRKHLGAGGNGDAYLAWDTSLRREAVIKRVRMDEADGEGAKRIMEEAAKMAAIKHPNIISIYDVSLSEGAPCIVMEHVQGGTLEKRVEERGPFSLPDFVELARQSLDALVAAHESGLIHRDIKPSNLMLSDLPSGAFQVKVVDFGLAKFVDPALPSPQTVAIDGSIHGSIHFISPEQLNGEPVGVRSDLYSLGGTLYFALTGAEPFRGETVAEIITAHLTGRFQPPGELRQDLTPALSEWLVTLLQRDPMQRFPGAMAALESLGAAAARDGIVHATQAIRVDRRSVSLPATPARPAAPEISGGGKEKRMLWPVFGGLVLIGVAVAGFFWGRVMPGSGVKEAAIAASAVGQPTSAATPEPTPLPTPEPTPVVVATPSPTPEAAPVVLAEAEKASEAPAPARVTFRATGSNTIGARLMPALVEAYLEKIGAKDIIRRKVTEIETEVSFDGRYGGERQAVMVLAHGSSTSFEALLKEETEVGMSSRPVKEKEREELAFLGDMYSPACEHVVGLDGLAVIVNPANPVSSLTVRQVADIFSGKIRDWSEVGGPAGPIHLYARDDVSGTFDSFKTMVLGEAPISPEAARFADSNELSDKVAVDTRGIGFIGLPYVRSSKALAISDEGTAPMIPSPFTVATEDYVLSRRLFFYTPAVPSHPWTGTFIEFVMSDEGQNIVEEVGFIPQRVDIEKIPTAAGMPPEYASLAETYSGRLSMTFRFLTGQAQLDAKGVRDLDRLVRFLARPENRRKALVLVGFSDNSGTPETNIKLSQERADEVARQLGLRGVMVSRTAGFGQAMPLASNETEVGRKKNRRVEVWIE